MVPDEIKWIVERIKGYKYVILNDELTKALKAAMTRGKPVAELTSLKWRIVG